MTSTATQFRHALENRRRLIGTFVRNAVAAHIEILAASGFDFLCLDAEHGTFDRAGLNIGILAARACDCPVLVRLPSHDPAAIVQSLDLGANGVILPHIGSANDAADAVRHCHYGPGGRGYAGSPRAAEYGARSMAEHLEKSRSDTAVIAMLEDPEAFDDLDGIFDVAELNGAFLGRADLTAALGYTSSDDDAITGIAENACQRARSAGFSIGVVLEGTAKIQHWSAQGANLFLVSSDLSLIRAGALALLEAARSSTNGDQPTGTGYQQ